jgi:hypothetical protein
MIAIAQTGEFHHDLAYRPGDGIEVTALWDAPADEARVRRLLEAGSDATRLSKPSHVHGHAGYRRGH